MDVMWGVILSGGKVHMVVPLSGGRLHMSEGMVSMCWCSFGCHVVSSQKGSLVFVGGRVCQAIRDDRGCDSLL